MIDALHYAIYGFISIFLITNPAEIALIFVSLTPGATSEYRKTMARRAIIIASSMAMMFALFGESILSFFGITVDTLSIAGGILLFILAIDMLMANPEHRNSIISASKGGDISIFPLSMPLLTGPGAITTILVLMQSAPTSLHQLAIFGSIVGVFVVGYGCLRAANIIDRVLGPMGVMVMTRLMGLMLSAIAVSFAIAGIKGGFGL